MHDEMADLEKTLGFIFSVITRNEGVIRRRIAEAYMEAQELMASIELERGSAHSRITACFERLDTYKASNDVAALGWMFTAIQQRIYEEELPGWEALAHMIENTEYLLNETVAD